MTARLCAFAIWALVAASAVFWGLRLGTRAPAAPAGTRVVETAAAAQGDLTRLFGAAPVAVAAAVAPPAESTRFRLTGVMAPRAATNPGTPYGLALIAVDGKPARAYRVGARIDGEMTLQSVSLRSATVGAPGAAPSFMLELPPLLPPATGSLPPVDLNAGAPPALTAASLMGRPPMQMPPPPTLPPVPMPPTEVPPAADGDAPPDMPQPPPSMRNPSQQR